MYAYVKTKFPDGFAVIDLGDEGRVMSNHDNESDAANEVIKRNTDVEEMYDYVKTKFPDGFAVIDLGEATHIVRPYQDGSGMVWYAIWLPKEGRYFSTVASGYPHLWLRHSECWDYALLLASK